MQAVLMESGSVGLPTLCSRVNADRAVVLPKSTTPSVGCTLRSLTHHLALLAPPSVVRADWLWMNRPITAANADRYHESRPINLLLLPYPYVVDGRCFQQTGPVFGGGPEDYVFGLEQRWLRDPEGSPLSADQLWGDLVSPLVKEALREVDQVNFVVFPESSLTADLVDGMAARAGQDEQAGGMEYLVCGVAREIDGATNLAAVHMLLRDEPVHLQGKHHRWMIERHQVARYNLGDAFSSRDGRWWEGIDVHDRAVSFHAFRRNACFAVLVCEDLARHDPAMPLIKSVGPNLVLALLMDGPQLKTRWPSQYAAVLADDPGSAVLTLTNLGMVRRSARPGDKVPTVVALWKQPGGDSQELSLPDGHHALLVTISPHRDPQVTLDGRTDNGQTIRYQLTGVRALRLPDPPPWLES